MTVFPQLFGKYELVEQIASGGMAEVFRARTFGAEGFQKPVAIKRILPHLSTQTAFIAMLTDEAKTVVRLLHANIVEVYDFGIVDHCYYVAMEFSDGVDLATLIAQCGERHMLLPDAMAAWIVRDVCRGLAYAHDRCDDDGQPLGIVHRDISPANILVARTGEVKLTDFGIAKAASNIFATETGMLKGKIAYMAPEQARGDGLDRRSDLFSLGLVLFELLTGRRFFSGGSQTDLLRKVQEIRIAEADISPSVPLGLRTIVARALAYDPAARYQHAGAMEEDLTIYLSGAAPNLTAEKVAKMVHPFMPSTPLWKPLAAVAHLLPKAYAPLATEVMKTSTIMRRPLGWMMICSGVLGDMLKPILASFASLLCAVSALSAVAVGFLLRRQLQRAPLAQVIASRLGMACVFLCASFVVWGVITLLQYATPARGVIATAVPPVASVQDLVSQIAGKVTVIEATTTEMAQDVKDIKQAIATLSNTEALVAHPQTPQEFYHNARVYQLRGMNGLAIDHYKAFLERAPDYIDPHRTVQLLVRDTPGASALTGWYETLARQHPQSVLVQCMRGLLPADRATRVATVEAIVTQHPDFVPAALYLAREWYEAGWVGKTERYLRRLDTLFASVHTALAHAQLQPYFIDKERLEQELEPMRAWRRYAESMATEWAKPPLTIKAEEGDYGVSMTFVAKEAGVTKILYGIDEPVPTKETGVIPGQINPLTHAPEPQNQIVGTIPDGKHTIYARYVDRDGALSPIVSHPFESRPFRVLTSLVHGPIGAPQVDLQITLDPKRGTRFRSYRYSIDSPTLDQTTDTARFLVKGLAVDSHILYVKGIDEQGTETAMFAIPFATE